MENSIIFKYWEYSAPILLIFITTVYFIKNKMTKSVVEKPNIQTKKTKLSEDEYIGGKDW